MGDMIESKPFMQTHSNSCLDDPALRILLVNDEPLILGYMQTLLEPMGHDVHHFVCCTEETAKKIVSEVTMSFFHIAFIDVMMPGITGDRLIEAIYSVSPSTRLIAMDGGLCIEVAAHLKSKGIVVQPLLCPFEVDELKGILEDTIVTLVTSRDTEVNETRVKAGGVSPEPRNFGKFQVVEFKRPYVRYCTWCGEEIPEGISVLEVRGLGKTYPRFCKEDCFQNWESIYWQRSAIGHLGLSVNEFRLEEKVLKRQKLFLGARTPRRISFG